MIKLLCYGFCYASRGFIKIYTNCYTLFPYNKTHNKIYISQSLEIVLKMKCNFDFSKNEIRISYSPELNNCLPERFEVDSKEVKVISSPENKLEQLDTKWSYLDKLNCVNITTGIHVDYHTPSDDAEFITGTVLEVDGGRCV